MSDLLTKVRKQLSISEDIERAPIADRAYALSFLRELARDIQNSQQAIGMVLWHLDPTPAEMSKLAEELGFKPATLTSWMTTYSRLRHDANLATVRFSMQQQLARVQNDEDRTKLWLSRPAAEWTLPALTTTVDAYTNRAGGMPPKKKAGCRATFGDRKLKATVTLTEDVVLIELAVSDGIELSEGDMEQTAKGMYRVRYTW